LAVKGLLSIGSDRKNAIRFWFSNTKIFLSTNV